MNTLKYILIALAALIGLSMASCIEDGFTTSSSDQPTFSVDTLKMGMLFTADPSPTHRFVVYNRHNKGLNISNIKVTGQNASMFRLNVDGMSGTEFNNVEIRANDSIYIFVEATLPQNGSPAPIDITADLSFLTNGVTSSIVLNAQGQDVQRLKALTVDTNTRLGDSGMPYQVFDSLVVAPGATLTLAPGTTLYMHDKSKLIVRGTLIAEGTQERPVNICGDRVGNVITDVTFDLMSKQWDGMWFTPSSKNNSLSHTCIRNTWFGVTVAGDLDSTDSTPMLTMVNSRLRNSGDYVLWVENASIMASGCEFAEAAAGAVVLDGGKHLFEQCTFANYYLFSAVNGPLVTLYHLNAENADPDNPNRPYTQADFNNCILYGFGSELSHGDLTGSKVFLRNCLLKSAGSDDDNFINCLWDADPLYYTVREDYIFDYRLKPESPAIGKGNASLNTAACAVDAYGNHRPATGITDIGAYVFTAPQQ